MNHKHLTESQKQDILKYLELVESNDIESVKLGIALFYEEYKTKFIKGSYDDCCYRVLINPEITFYYKHDIEYWIGMLKALLSIGYYEI